MSAYTKTITLLLKTYRAPDVDPRHIEAYMRISDSTLDGIDPLGFICSFEIALDCVRQDAPINCENLARSYGL